MNESAIHAAKENRAFIVQDDIKKSFIKVGLVLRRGAVSFQTKRRRLQLIMRLAMQFCSMYCRM